MAHWAEIDDDGLVLRVTVSNNDEPDEGYQWLIDSLGGRWVQTSYNATIRKNYAGIGFTYDADRDAFIPPKPYPSWVLDEATCQWGAPIAYPTDGADYVWDEQAGDWVFVDETV
tara:strand:+ start:2292 stop:2633 length:342 start_codon:yes stop_codon:yes gene_type:complete